MASSGSFNTTGYEGRYLTFKWQITKTDIENNKTTISWTLTGAGTGQAGWYKAGNFSVYIDGFRAYTSSTRIQLYNGTQVASGTHTFTHNTDGSRSFEAYAEAGIYTTAVNCSGSGKFTLDEIPRASQPSCVTWPNHTQNVGNFGDTISIHMNRKSDAFTHTVKYAFGDLRGTIASGVTTGTTWTIPLWFMDYIPNTTSGSGTIFVETYKGSEFIGQKSCGFTATVPSTVKPTCSMKLTDISEVDKIYGSPVQALSSIQVQITAAEAYSSPIKSYEVTIDGTKYTLAEFTTGALKKSGTSPVTVKVTDSRGRVGTTSYNMNVQSYIRPSVSKLTVKRCNSDGTDNDQGQYIQVTYSAKVSPMYQSGTSTARNTATYTLKYKKSSVDSWTQVNLTSLANVFTATDRTYIFQADVISSYDIELSVADRHNTATRLTSASTAFSLIDFHPSGSGLRFGGVAEEENTLQNDLSLRQVGNRYTLSSPGVASSAGYVRMAQITITAANADTPITFVFSQRQKPSTMTVYVSFDNADLSTSLGAAVYEGSNYGAFLVKTSNLAYDLYVTKASSYDTITLQDWYTSKTMESRVAVSFPGDLVQDLPTPYTRATPAKLQSLLDFIYPVGSIYMSYSHVSPAALFGGTWVRIENAFLWGVDSKGEIGLTGGAKTHTLTVNELPSHTHGSVYSGNASGTKTHAWLASGGSSMAYGTVATGEGAAHNNMPPYVQVSIWRRTA